MPGSFYVPIKWNQFLVVSLYSFATISPGTPVICSQFVFLNVLGINFLKLNSGHLSKNQQPLLRFVCRTIARY